MSNRALLDLPTAGDEDVEPYFPQPEVELDVDTLE
jgi:hypothetical protein